MSELVDICGGRVVSDFTVKVWVVSNVEEGRLVTYLKQNEAESACEESTHKGVI